MMKELTTLESENELETVAKRVNPTIKNGTSEFHHAWRLCFDWIKGHQDSLQSKGKTKEEILQDKFNLPQLCDWYKPVLQAMEEYAQSYDNQDGWVSVEDLRNKLSPITNLIAMLESSELLYHHETEMHKLIEREIEQCKKSIEYLLTP